MTEERGSKVVGSLILPLEQVRLDVGDAVQKQNAVQVVNLVLQDDGLEAFGVKADWLTIQSPSPPP